MNIFKKKSGKNFFDYPAKEKKKIIKEAVNGSNEKQTELVKKYDLLYTKA